MYFWGLIDFAIEDAETAAQMLADKVRSTSHDGSTRNLSVLQIIKSIDKAIELDRNNTQIMRRKIE